MYFIKGDYKSAWQKFTRSLEICEKHEIVPGIITNTMNLARIVVKINNYDLENNLQRDHDQINDFKEYHTLAVKKVNL